MISNLDQRVIIQSRSITVTNGQQVEGFSTVGTRWANVNPVRANERNAGGIEFYTDAYRFRFHSEATTTAITPAYRLQWGNRDYDVKQGPNPSDDRWVEVVAERVVPRA